MVSNPAEADTTIAGTILFRQRENEETIHIFGSLHMDAELVEVDEGRFGEWRGMAITENEFN